MTGLDTLKAKLILIIKEYATIQIGDEPDSPKAPYENDTYLEEKLLAVIDSTKVQTDKPLLNYLFALIMQINNFKSTTSSMDQQINDLKTSLYHFFETLINLYNTKCNEFLRVVTPQEFKIQGFKNHQHESQFSVLAYSIKNMFFYELGLSGESRISHINGIIDDQLKNIVIAVQDKDIEQLREENDKLYSIIAEQNLLLGSACRPKSNSTIIPKVVRHQKHSNGLIENLSILFFGSSNSSEAISNAKNVHPADRSANTFQEAAPVNTKLPDPFF